MNPQRFFLALVMLATIATSLKAQLSVDFEAGPPAGWTAEGLWHVTSACPRPSDCNPVNWAYYGVDGACDYNVGTSEGTLLSPDVLISSGSLTYCSAYAGEGPSFSLDTATVELLFSLDGPLEDSPDWTMRTVDLSGYAGMTVRLIWPFEAASGGENGGLGWQIDDVRLTEIGESTPFLTQSFEGGIPNFWTATGLWHATAACARPSLPCDGSAAWAYYGVDASCSFETGAPGSGELRSYPVVIPDGGATLTYCSAYEGGSVPGLDQAVLRIAAIVDGPLEPPAGEPDWETRTVDVSAFTGQVARLLFRFDSGDDAFNDTLGWQVDNISFEEGGFVRGDDNGDGAINIADPIYSLSYLFQSGPSRCLNAQDTNADGANNLADAIYGLSYLFVMGPPPPEPFPSCGPDPAGGVLGCDEYGACP